MVCKECGKEFDDSLDYCPECGAPANSPVVVSMTKGDIKKAGKNFEKKERDMQKVNRARANAQAKIDAKTASYEGPVVNLVGYVKSLFNNSANLIAFMGAILVYLAPFFAWIWYEIQDKKIKADLFFMSGDVIDKYSTDIKLNQPILFAAAVIILVVGFLMLLMSARAYIKPLWNFRYNYLVRFIPVIVGVADFLLIYFNKVFQAKLDEIKLLVDSAKKFGMSGACKGGIGLGALLFLIGIGLYIISIVIDYLKKN